MRFIRVVVFVAVLAGVFAAVAAAGGYTDASYLTPIGTVGTPYSHQIAWKPGNGCPPYSYHLDPGNYLPPGLSLNSSSGWITGTPTKAGTYTFYVSQVDLCGVEGQGNSPFRITIQPGASTGGLPLSVTSSAAPAAEVGLAYSLALTAAGGGGGTRVWSVTRGQLPAGLTLSNSGQITGTPSSAGMYTFTVTVSNGTSSASKSFGLTVIPGITVNTSPTVPTAEVRTQYSASVADVLGISGGAPPYRYAPVAGFPFGVGFDPTTGTIFGAPRKPGTLNLTISVTDANHATKQVTLAVVVVPKLHIVPIALHRGHRGKRYRAKVTVTGGQGPEWSVSAGRLPTGLRLNPKTGVIRGVATRKGSSAFVVSVHDSLGAKVSIRYTITIGG